MGRKLARRDFLRYGGGALAGTYVLGLAACGGGGGGGQGGSESENARLRMTWWGEQKRHERTQAALKAFQERNPGIDISAELSGGEGYFDKLITQASGGNAPDVFQSEPNQFAELSQRGGILLELDQFVPGVLAVGDWPEEVVQLNQVDGKLLGVPMGLNSFMVLYDAAAFEKAGVGQPEEDWTWEDFRRITGDVRRAASGDVYGTEDASGDSYMLETFVRQRGKELFTEEGQLGFEKVDLADWWEYWYALREDGAAVPAEIQALSIGDVTNTPLATGKAAVEFDFSNRLIAFSGLVDGDLGYNVVPNGPSGSRYGMYLRPALTMCVYGRSDNPEAAIKVINSLVNVPEVASSLGTERGVPPSPEIRELLEPDLDDQEREIIAYVERVSEQQEPMTILRPLGAADLAVGPESLLFRTAAEISFGRTSIDEGVDRFFEEAEGILS